MTAAERRPALPDGLRDRLSAATLRARAAGRPVPAAPGISPAEAFSRAADALYRTPGVLQAEDWRRSALRDPDVQGLVGHLTGVEEDVRRGLAGTRRWPGASHAGSTQAAADRQAGRSPAPARAEWRHAADRTLDLVHAADPDAEVAVHGMRLPLSMLLVVRAFELWVHENDIRTGRHRAGGSVIACAGPSDLHGQTGKGRDSVVVPAPDQLTAIHARVTHNPHIRSRGRTSFSRSRCLDRGGSHRSVTCLAVPARPVRLVPARRRSG